MANSVPLRYVLCSSTLLLLLLSLMIPSPALVYAQSTTLTRVSVTTDGAQADGASEEGGLLAAEGIVAFHSAAENLVPNDNNGVTDAFVHDRITGSTTLVSVSSSGEPGNATSYVADITPDGRYIVLASYATNLVAPVLSQEQRVFVHDRTTGETTLVSVASNGAPANDFSSGATISDNGRIVAFSSDAGNLCLIDNDGDQDIFVHDRETGETTCVSVNADGEIDNGRAWNSNISGDGRYVVFTSDADNLFANDSNNANDIFVHDRLSGQTRLVSLSSLGEPANRESLYGTISANGRYVAFVSRATNLASNDPARQDVFVHDLHTRTTTRVTYGVAGASPNQDTLRLDISADGRFIVFESFASNLVPDDTVTCTEVFDFEINCPDIFFYDRAASNNQVLMRLSETPGGVAANRESYAPTISGDGRYVLFSSWATNLTESDTNNEADLFLLDRATSAPLMTVRGVITTTESMELTNVVVMVDGFSVLADADGTFVQPYLSPEPYRVTPVRTGYLFDPPQQIIMPDTLTQFQAAADEVLSFTAYPAQTIFLPALQRPQEATLSGYPSP